MNKIDVMYLCDRIVAWNNNFAPYEEPLTVQDVFSQIAFTGSRKTFIAGLNQIYEEMSVDNESDEKSFKELGNILEELSKI